MIKFLRKKQNSGIWLMGLSVLEGLAAGIILFVTPSEKGNAWIFGVSRGRVLVGGVIILAALCLGILSIAVCRFPDWRHKIREKLDNHLEVENHLLLWTMVLLFGLVFLIGLYLIILFVLPASGRWNVIPEPLLGYLGAAPSVLLHVLSVAIWFPLLLIQTLAWLLLNYTEKYRKMDFWVPNIIISVFFLYMAVALTFLHWIYLYFRIQVFVLIPNWFWKFFDKPLAYPWVLVIIFIISMAVAVIILKLRGRIGWLSLLLLILFGYVIQISLGFAAGKGYESLHELYIERGHRSFPLFASDLHNTWDVLTHYDQVIGQDSFLKTKPPGIVLIYMAAEKFVNWVQPAATPEARFDILTGWISAVFPLFFCAVLPALYCLCKSLLGKENAFIPVLLFLFIPNVILQLFELDQVLYPFLFTLNALLVLWTIRSQSWVWAVLNGVLIYLSCFISFSLLPMAILAGLWIGINYLQNRHKRSLGKVVFMLACMIGGVLLMYGIFRFALGYDAISRYGNAMAQHRWHKDFIFDLPHVLEAMYVNNAETVLWLGMPVVLLVLFRLVRSIINFIKKKSSKLDGLVAAFFLTYLFLNLFGQTRTEVARLWVFLTPLLALFAGTELRTLFSSDLKNTRWQTWGIYLVLALQNITLLLIYKFQDMK